MELDPDATLANRGLLIFEDSEALDKKAQELIEDYDKRFYQRFKVYTEWTSHPSDRWVFSFTHFVETVMSLGVSQYYFWIVTSSFLVVFVNILWSLIFTIPQVNDSFNKVNYYDLFGLLTFLASFFYYEIFNYNKEISFNTLRLYRKSMHIISWINSAYEIAFDHLMKEYTFRSNDIITLEKKMDKKSLIYWYNTNIQNIKKMYIYLIILNIYSLRIYLSKDVQYDYEYIGFSKDELLKVLIKYQKSRKTKYDYSADQIFLFTLKEIEKTAQFFPIISTARDIQNFKILTLNNILNNVNLLKTNFLESSTIRHVPLPNIYIVTRNAFVFFWIYVIIPFISYWTAHTLLFVFGSLLMIILQVPLIHILFISKPFTSNVDYAGPNFYKWRKQVYQEIRSSFKKIEKMVLKIRADIEKV